MASTKPSGFKKFNWDVVGLICVVFMVGFYALPFLINLGKTFTLYPKNIPNFYFNYLPGFLFKESILKFGVFPLWTFFWEGGRPFFENLSDISLSPFSFLVLIFGEVKGLNISWYMFFIVGVCSMYYLCRYVFKFNVSGAIFSSLVFSMSGAFGYLLEDGFMFCREVLLLPLFMAFFIKAKENKKFIFFASLILSTMLFQTALFFPVIILFIFLFAVLQSVDYREGKLVFDLSYLRIFILVCICTILFSSVKIIPLLRALAFNNRISGLEYTDSLSDPNTLSLFLKRIFIPGHHGPGTMYLGLVPVLFALLGAAICFWEVKSFIFILFLFIVLSFGPNSPIDLHRLLWHLPFFKSMREIAKYYSVIIVFLVSILAGKSFIIFHIRRIKIINCILPAVFILFAYFNLLNANIGYLNVFKEDLRYRSNGSGNFHIKGLNIHQGNESIIEPLIYFLAKKDIGIIYPNYVLNRPSKVVPKYFILPKYAFMSPYTSLVVIPNPEYKGEAFFLELDNKVENVRFLSNNIFVKVDMKISGRLIINQNFDSDWQSDTAKVSEFNGLISLQLNDPVKKTIRMRYIPKLFLSGLMISIISLFLAGYMLIRKK